MANRTETVDQFLAVLDHPLKVEIETVRRIILSANPQITEHIKWNAPSFCFHGQDRVTLRLQPGDRLQIVFHQGAKLTDSTDFAFDDSTGILTWVARDRATITLRDMEDVKEKQTALINVVKHWMKATTA